jgi:hypothetical protein
MAKPGPKTELDDALFKEIRKAIIEGKNLKETANVCGIDEQKLYNWKYDNFLNISDKIEGWKRDRKILMATRNLEEILDMQTSKDPALLRIKADMTKFTLETLDKDTYSKRNELTGKGGESLGTIVLPQKDAISLETDK